MMTPDTRRAPGSSFDGVRTSVMDRRTAAICLTAILVVAFSVRLWGLRFGLPFVLARPDELLIVSTALGFFTKGLNPRFFDYPALYLYLVFAIFVGYYAWGRAAGWFTSVAHYVGGTHGRWPMFYFLGRAATATFGTLNVLWIYRIGAAVFDELVGLTAAFFLSLTFLHVRDSHYATTDVTMTLLVTCAVFALVRLHGDRRPRHAWVAGLFAGLAMGTKYNAALVAAPMGIVELLHAWPNRRDWRTVLRETYLPRMLVVMLAAFLATSPYLILDYPKAMQDFRALQESMSVGMTPAGMLDPGWIYHLKFSLLYGLGVPLLVASLAGIVVMALRNPAATLILLSFPAAYYVVAGASANVFVRYMIPELPFLCLTAAVMVDAIAAAITRATRVSRPVVTAALAAIVISPSALSVVQFDRILAQPDSRVVAAEWVLENVPLGASVFTTGNLYGHPPLEDRVNPKYRLVAFDYRANNFIEKNRRFEGLPDWIIVQRSGIPYSHIPPLVLDLLPAQYELVHVVRAIDLDLPGNVYDIQDAFYMPYGGFRGLRRPGPNLEIYRKKPS